MLIHLEGKPALSSQSPVYQRFASNNCGLQLRAEIRFAESMADARRRRARIRTGSCQDRTGQRRWCWRWWCCLRLVKLLLKCFSQDPVLINLLYCFVMRLLNSIGGKFDCLSNPRGFRDHWKKSCQGKAFRTVQAKIANLHCCAWTLQSFETSVTSQWIRKN